MIFTVEPCRKSSGVKKNPQIRPPTKDTTASTATHGKTRSVVWMNFLGFAYSQSDLPLIPVPICSAQVDLQYRSRGERQKRDGAAGDASQHQKRRHDAQPLNPTARHLGAKDQCGDIKRQDKKAQQKPAPFQPDSQRRPKRANHAKRGGAEKKG